MICPKCKAEYVRGITVCADCGVPLVYTLPEEKKLPPKPPYKRFMEVGNAGEIAIIKSILDDAEIDYYFQGETAHAVYMPMLEPAILMIREDQFKTVAELLKELDTDKRIEDR